MSLAGQGVADTLARSLRVETVTDEPTWSDAISRLNGSVLQSWPWGEFKRRHGWKPFRLLVRDPDGPVLAAQALSRSVGPMSVLYVPRGPAGGEYHSAAISALTLALDRLARQERAAITFIEPNDDLTLPPDRAALSGWNRSPVELQPLRTIIIPVDCEDENLLSGMKNKTRYNVRLAGRRGIIVRKASIDEVPAFYELLEETGERDEFGIHSVDYYADMLDVFGESSVLLVAEFEGKLAAGAILLKHDDEAIYMFGASSKAFQRHMPTHLLQFEAMRWARQNGCRRYDLWGIPATDTPPDEAHSGELNVRSGLWGVYRFKQGFGGNVVSYPGVFERQHYPRLVRLWRKFRSGPGA